MMKKVVTRQQIVEAAIRVFGRKSYRDANISEIAKEANVAEGTIYQHFMNKEDLFFFIPQEKTHEFLEGLDLHLQGIQDTPNKIAKFVWYYLYFFKTNPEYARIVMLDMRVSKSFLKAKGYNLLRRFASMVLDVIKEGQREKTIRDDINPYIIRQLLLGVLEHGVARWLLKGEKGDLLEFHTQIVKLVLDGIRNDEVSGENRGSVRKKRPERSPASGKELHKA
ncbi:MAG: Fatty acid metabolism regulator protein [Syntrophorhabdus sp. PtaU1.Bin058]|nr:MAG: Fatty acid metabolism regulator protein [Syntrophorhabdus sp. PtaU1.Bin058]